MNKILNIVFFDETLPTGEIVKKACIFRKNEEPRYVDERAGKAAFLELKKQRKLKGNINKNINVKYVYKLTKEQLNENLEHFKKSTRNPLPRSKERKAETKQKIKSAIAVVTVGGIIATTIGLAVSSSKDKKKNSGYDDDYSSSQSQENDENFDSILQRSLSLAQVDAINNMKSFFEYYNTDFKNGILESGEAIELGLTWDEVVSLSIAFNNYNSQKLREIFNDSNLDKEILNDSFLAASIQLTKAFLLANGENTVGLDTIINNDSQKDFYEEYYNMFLNGKKDDEKIVAKFFEEVRQEFPIISSKNGVVNKKDAYKFSIVPMINALAILYPNSKGVLTSDELYSLNSFALKLAEESFEQAEIQTQNISYQGSASFNNLTDAISTEFSVLYQTNDFIPDLPQEASMTNYNNIISMILGTYDNSIEEETTVAPTTTEESTTYNFFADNHKETTKPTYDFFADNHKETTESTYDFFADDHKEATESTYDFFADNNNTSPETYDSYGDSGSSIIEEEVPWEEDDNADIYSNPLGVNSQNNSPKVLIKK